MTTAALHFLRAQNAVLGRIAPDRAAAAAQDLFLQPRRAAERPWEAEVEASAERFRLKVGFSVLRWRADRDDAPRVLCMHGWEGRATQFGVLAATLRARGLEVVALDGPGHGRSAGREAHPVEFARAMLAADRELGPFDAVVGHSMGGAATSLALAWGLRAERAVLLASPSSIDGVLERFADVIGLPPPARARLMARVESTVGFARAELNVAHAAEGLSIPALVVHDRADLEVPYADGQAIAERWPGATLLPVEGLGHRRVLRDPSVVQAVASFLRAEPEPSPQA